MKREAELKELCWTQDRHIRFGSSKNGNMAEDKTKIGNQIRRMHLLVSMSSWSLAMAHLLLLLSWNRHCHNWENQQKKALWVTQCISHKSQCSSSGSIIWNGDWCWFEENKPHIISYMSFLFFFLQWPNLQSNTWIVWSFQKDHEQHQILGAVTPYWLCCVNLNQ